MAVENVDLEPDFMVSDPGSASHLLCLFFFFFFLVQAIELRGA